MGGVVKTIVGVALTVVGVLTVNPALIAAGVTTTIGGVAQMMAKPPKISPSSTDRLGASINPTAPRTMVFGRTAFATDIRYQERTGTDQEYLWWVIALASHKVEAIEELWIDDRQAWTSSGGVTGTFSGYLDVYAVTEGSSANITSISSKWGAATNRRLTGVAHLDLRFKLTGNSKKSESPFSSGVSTRITVIGKAIPVYDPRLDTTNGGSGAHRPDDRDTWEYSNSGDDIGRNPALVLLAYLLGWTINDKLAVGRGVPADRIDLDSFIAGANLCDETVTLAAGGTEPRYRFDGIFSEADDGSTVIDNILASMNAVLHDDGGKLALQVRYNDLATPVPDFTDDDVLSAVKWRPVANLSEDRNIVRGRYTSPSTGALYQLVDYPQVSLASPDGIDRILTIDFPGVQSASQAQRLAKQILQRYQYSGTLEAEFNAKAWGVKFGDVVTLTLATLGFEEKLFRVVERTISFDGRNRMVLREENDALYAWDAEEEAEVTPITPTEYDPLNNAIVQQLATIETNADVTATATPSMQLAPTQTVNADHTGAVLAGELPRTLVNTRKRGDANVDSDTTWSATFPAGITGTIDNSSADENRGNIEITGCTASGEISVSSTRDGVTLAGKITVTKIDAPPPTSGSSSAGSSTASGTVSISTSSTSYSGGLVLGPVRAPASGTIELRWPGRYGTTNFGEAYGAGKWQSATASGGPYTDVDAETVSTVSASREGAPEFAFQQGDLMVNEDATGLTPGADYYFRVQARRSSGSSITLNFSGTASATAA